VNPHCYQGIVEEVKAGKVDEDVVKLTKLKCLHLVLENPMIDNLLHQLIPEGVLEKLKFKRKVSENRHESLKNFFTSQINIKSLNALDINLEWIKHLQLEKFSYNVRRSQVQPLVEFFKKQESLKDVSLWFDGVEIVDMNRVLECLRTARKIKLKWVETISVDTMLILKNLPHLQEIELRIYCNGELRATQNIEALTFVVLPSMKKLELTGIGELSNDLISRLAPSFPKLKKLPLNKTEIPEYNFLLDSFSEFEKFYYSQKGEDRLPRFELRGNVYSKLKEIDIRCFNENEAEVEREDFQSLINLVRAAPNLEKFDLFIDYSEFSSDQFCELFESFRELKSLFMCLNFPRNFVIYRHVDRFVQALKSIEKFPKVRLVFYVQEGFKEIYLSLFKAALQVNAIEDIEVLSVEFNDFIIQEKNQKK
jgi:hypothetical protein